MLKLASLVPNNMWDLLRQQEYSMWKSIMDAGGIKNVVLPVRMRKVYGEGWREPYLSMPPRGLRLRRLGSIALPADGTVDGLVVSYTVPQGYDGVINGVTVYFTGTGFIDGSGDLVFRLRVGRRFAKDLGDVRTQLGSNQQPFPLGPGGVRVQSQDVITWTVDTSAGASNVLNPGNVVCSFSGWTYPQQ